MAGLSSRRDSSPSAGRLGQRRAAACGMRGLGPLPSPSATVSWPLPPPSFDGACALFSSSPVCCYTALPLVSIVAHLLHASQMCARAVLCTAPTLGPGPCSHPRLISTVCHLRRRGAHQPAPGVCSAGSGAQSAGLNELGKPCRRILWRVVPVSCILDGLGSDDGHPLCFACSPSPSFSGRLSGTNASTLAPASQLMAQASPIRCQ